MNFIFHKINGFAIGFGALAGISVWVGWRLIRRTGESYKEASTIRLAEFQVCQSIVNMLSNLQSDHFAKHAEQIEKLKAENSCIINMISHLQCDFGNHAEQIEKLKTENSYLHSKLDVVIQTLKSTQRTLQMVARFEFRRPRGAGCFLFGARSDLQKYIWSFNEKVSITATAEAVEFIQIPVELLIGDYFEENILRYINENNLVKYKHSTASIGVSNLIKNALTKRFYWFDGLKGKGLYVLLAVYPPNQEYGNHIGLGYFCGNRVNEDENVSQIAIRKLKEVGLGVFDDCMPSRSKLNKLQQMKRKEFEVCNTDGGLYHYYLDFDAMQNVFMWFV